MPPPSPAFEEKLRWLGMMRMDVSGMNYAELQKAFENAKWTVERIARHGDRIVLECALS